MKDHSISLISESKIQVAPVDFLANTIVRCIKHGDFWKQSAVHLTGSLEECASWSDIAMVMNALTKSIKSLKAPEFGRKILEISKSPKSPLFLFPEILSALAKFEFASSWLIPTDLSLILGSRNVPRHPNMGKLWIGYLAQFFKISAPRIAAHVLQVKIRAFLVHASRSKGAKKPSQPPPTIPTPQLGAKLPKSLLNLSTKSPFASSPSTAAVFLTLSDSAELRDSLIAQILEFENNDEFRAMKLESEVKTVENDVLMGHLRESGLLGKFGIDLKHGGFGLRHRDIAKVLIMLSALNSPTASLVLHQFCLAGDIIQSHMTDDGKGELRSQFVSGSILGSLAVTEESSGSALTTSITTTARPILDSKQRKWIISGEKMYVGYGAVSSFMTVLAKELSEEGHETGRMTAFWVDSKMEGVSIGKEWNISGISEACPINRVRFDNVRVIKAKHQLDVDAFKGFDFVAGLFSKTRWAIAATCLGAMKRGVRMAHSFAGHRPIFTGLLVDNIQAQCQLADMSHLCDSLENSVMGIAVLFESEHANVNAFMMNFVTAVVKVWATEECCAALDGCIQLLGARGLSSSNEIVNMLKTARVTRTLEGSTEALLSMLSGMFFSQTATFDVMVTELFGFDLLQHIQTSVNQVMSFASLPLVKSAFNHHEQNLQTYFRHKCAHLVIWYFAFGWVNANYAEMSIGRLLGIKQFLSRKISKLIHDACSAESLPFPVSNLQAIVDASTDDISCIGKNPSSEEVFDFGFSPQKASESPIERRLDPLLRF
ncbi:hypothetical protein HDU98_001946 [Podochytrium sp. JEL0797]|nr:hypothetical protein HDU98_001946 [Podochytrium sp. JEL0797]